MHIDGFQPLTLLDWPGKVGCTVFLGGCNFRCPFCHNGPLVEGERPAPAMTLEEFRSFLTRRQGLLDGVCVSGGEPLLNPQLPQLLELVKHLGYLVKVDTNGSFPQRLVELWKSGLVDYVAMDIKNSRAKYAETVGVPGFDTAPVEESVRLLERSGVDHEFRTTLVRELHTAEDLDAIALWLRGAPRYFLQNFVDSGNLIGRGYHSFTAEELHGFAERVRPFFGAVELRGVN